MVCKGCSRDRVEKWVLGSSATFCPISVIQHAVHGRLVTPGHPRHENSLDIASRAEYPIFPLKIPENVQQSA